MLLPQCLHYPLHAALPGPHCEFLDKESNISPGHRAFRVDGHGLKGDLISSFPQPPLTGGGHRREREIAGPPSPYLQRDSAETGENQR